MLKEAAAVEGEHVERGAGLQVTHAEEINEDGGLGLVALGRAKGQNEAMSPRCFSFS
jgi:hypothetical protein